MSSILIIVGVYKEFEEFKKNYVVKKNYTIKKTIFTI